MKSVPATRSTGWRQVLIKFRFDSSEPLVLYGVKANIPESILSPFSVGVDHFSGLSRAMAPSSGFAPPNRVAGAHRQPASSSFGKYLKNMRSVGTNSICFQKADILLLSSASTILERSSSRIAPRHKGSSPDQLVCRELKEALAPPVLSGDPLKVLWLSIVLSFRKRGWLGDLMAYST